MQDGRHLFILLLPGLPQFLFPDSINRVVKILLYVKMVQYDQGLFQMLF